MSDKEDFQNIIYKKILFFLLIIIIFIFLIPLISIYRTVTGSSNKEKYGYLVAINLLSIICYIIISIIVVLKKDKINTTIILILLLILFILLIVLFIISFYLLIIYLKEDEIEIEKEKEIKRILVIENSIIFFLFPIIIGIILYFIIENKLHRNILLLILFILLIVSFIGVINGITKLDNKQESDTEPEPDSVTWPLLDFNNLNDIFVLGVYNFIFLFIIFCWGVYTKYSDIKSMFF